ncbi:EamA family transporter [Thalassovita mangrovi]|uniref:EamA family transporter n=1 Tax=Thalassovita mangrovi TaxID=2692236 RepID=A0A6L8LNF0_9RHOB|nr:EamA family transporter [Thalassovita mangrovi]MYM57571.1 EamA family transporter [Thalassovita mangrovi]
MPIPHLLLGLLVALFWAANFIAVRLGLDAGLSPALLTALRFLAVAMLAPFVPRPFGWPTILALGAAIGIGQLGLSTLAIAVGLSPGIASLAMQTQAFFTVVLAAVFLGEAPKINQVLGMLIAGAGIAALGFGQDATGGAPWLGIVLILCAALSWAASNILLRRQRNAASPIAIAVWVATISALPLLLLSWSLEGPPLDVLSSVKAPAWALGVVIYSAVFSTLAATSIWSWLLGRHPANQVAPLSLLVPVFGLSLSALVLGERFSALDMIAAALVMVGLVLFLLPKRVRNEPAPARGR